MTEEIPLVPPIFGLGSRYSTLDTGLITADLLEKGRFYETIQLRFTVIESGKIRLEIVLHFGSYTLYIKLRLFIEV